MTKTLIKLCPECNTEMHYTPEAKNRIVATISGLKEWSFKGFYRCKSKKCRYVIEEQ